MDKFFCLLAFGAMVCGLPCEARAEPRLTVPGAPAPVQDAAAQLDYDAYVAGLNILKVQGGLRLRPDGYEMGIAFQTSGSMGLLFHGEDRSLSQGRLQGLDVLPATFVSAGVWRGEDRRTEIAYVNGQPVIRTLLPAVSKEREPVPEAMQRNTLDTLSAMVLLLRHVAATGGCDGKAATFDGRRLTSAAVHTVGQVMLPRESRSSYSGPAVQCDVVGQQVAGFPFDAEPDDYVRRPHTASVWFARLVPGMPPLPVRMSFETRFLGHLTMYVTRAQAGMRTAIFTPER
jgi:hypothetical protein